ncbi:MAG: hypothetical protein ACLR7U_09590 [Ruthenibacterium lactatiformans]
MFAWAHGDKRRPASFGTGGHPRVLCRSLGGRGAAGAWGVHAVWACSAALLAAFGLMLAGR